MFDQTHRENEKLFIPFVVKDLTAHPPSTPTGTVLRPNWGRLELRNGKTLYASWSPVPGSQSYEIAVNTSPSPTGAVLLQGGLTGSFVVIPLYDGSGSEQILNGGFESGTLTFWQKEFREGVVMAIVTDEDSHSGTYSAMISHMGLPIFGNHITQTFSASPGKEYSYSIWYRRGGALDVPARGYIEWLDSNMETVGGLQIFTGNPSTWTNATGSITAPANTAYGKLYLGYVMPGYTVDERQYWFDDVSIVGVVEQDWASKLFAIRAIQVDGTVTQYSDWMKPVLKND